MSSQRLERRGGLKVSALYSGSSGPGSSPGRGLWVEFLRHWPLTVPLPTQMYPAMDWHPIQGRVQIFLVDTETGISSGTDGPLGSYADFTFT